MGGIVGSDGLTDDDRDESKWLQSDKDCEGCGENIQYADECVLLRLVYPAPYNGEVTLLDALEEDGSYTAEPLLFCYECWDGYAEDLRTNLNDMFVTKKTSASPSPLRCSFCSKPLNWGDYCCYAAYGELGVSPRTQEATFTPSKYESVEHAELLCLDCLAWINEEHDENIWTHLWVEEGVLDGSEG